MAKAEYDAEGIPVRTESKLEGILSFRSDPSMGESLRQIRNYLRERSPGDVTLVDVIRFMTVQVRARVLDQPSDGRQQESPPEESPKPARPKRSKKREQG